MLTAPVEVVEPTGAETMRSCRSASTRSSAASTRTARRASARLMPLGIDMAQACLFDPETQALIPQVAA